MRSRSSKPPKRYVPKTCVHFRKLSVTWGFWMCTQNLIETWNHRRKEPFTGQILAKECRVVSGRKRCEFKKLANTVLKRSHPHYFFRVFFIFSSQRWYQKQLIANFHSSNSILFMFIKRTTHIHSHMQLIYTHKYRNQKRKHKERQETEEKPK